MKWVKEIHLKNFRNFEKLSLSFTPNINMIVGENGIGKTNLLESIHMLSTGRSFRTSELKELILKGADHFTIDALFEDEGIEQSLTLTFNGKTRSLKHNATLYKSFSSLLGLLPSVIYAPSDISLIIGFPKERRRFLNIELSQSDPLYVYYLTRYAKALAQRNSLLKQKKTSSIEVWEEELIKSGRYIVHKRVNLLTDLTIRTNNEYKDLARQEESLKIQYLPSIEESDFTREKFEKMRSKELVMGYTLIGPHRDDFEINLNGHNAKKYASEGQKRTIISAIKLASLSRFDDPIFSIDDFGTHLDEERKSLLKKQLQGKDQIFLTMPHAIQLDSQVNILSLECMKRWRRDPLTSSRETSTTFAG